MKLTSSDFENEGDLPEEFTCQGEGISPALFWSEIPTEAKSLALSLNDPDAPSGDFIHWQIVNIPASATGVDQNQTIGDELPNSGGSIGYYPPCPPSGKHHYIFTIYALDVENIEPSTVMDFYAAIKPYIIGQAELSSTYAKS